MATIFSENSEKKTANFICEKCDYICFKKQHLKQHFLSKKHKNIFVSVEKYTKIGVAFGNIKNVANKIRLPIANQKMQTIL